MHLRMSLQNIVHTFFSLFKVLTHRESCNRSDPQFCTSCSGHEYSTDKWFWMQGQWELFNL